jgi:thioredoxin-like negative regulator of GroEL
MTSMLLAATIHTAMMIAGADAGATTKDTYADARQTTSSTGKPMVVMVSTDWCPPCQVMKKVVMPRVREHGLLRKVAFALVNPDRDRELARQLIGNGPIPQLVMFRKKGDGWVQKSLVGGQSVEAVEDFIKEGLVNDDAEKDHHEKNDKTPESHDTPSDGNAAEHG